MTHHMRVILFCLCFFHHDTNTVSKPAIAIAATGISLASIYGFYRLLNKPAHYTPTIKSMDTLTFRRAHTRDEPITPIDDLVLSIHDRKTPEKATVIIHDEPYTVHRGIDVRPEDKTIFIYSRGYARTNIPGENDNFIQHGAGAKIGHVLLSDNIIHDAPLITFDYPDERRHFNFAQALDIQCLQTVYHAAHEKNKAAGIVLIGDCRGAKVAFEIATENPPQLKALIALSPFICAQDLSNKIADSYLKALPFSRELLCTFFECYFPSYDPKKEDLIDRIAMIPTNVPIYMGHRSADTLIANETIDLMVNAFRETGHTVHLTIINDTSEPHSKLTSNPEIQSSINLFLKKYDLPYDPVLIQPQQLQPVSATP